MPPLCVLLPYWNADKMEVWRAFDIKVKLLCRRVQKIIGGAEDARSTDCRTVPYDVIDVDECALGRDPPDASGTSRNTTEQTN